MAYYSYGRPLNFHTFKHAILEILSAYVITNTKVILIHAYGSKLRWVHASVLLHACITTCTNKAV